MKYSSVPGFGWYFIILTLRVSNIIILQVQTQVIYYITCNVLQVEIHVKL